jgi:hypothetical protein
MCINRDLVIYFPRYSDVKVGLGDSPYTQLEFANFFIQYGNSCSADRRCMVEEFTLHSLDLCNSQSIHVVINEISRWPTIDTGATYVKRDTDSYYSVEIGYVHSASKSGETPPGVCVAQIFK